MQHIDWISLPGLIDYNTGLDLMQQRTNDVILNKKKEAVFLLEHQDVYTAGTSYKDDELLSDSNNIPVIYTGRGGKFTYHGPGQRVIYPILNLAGKNRSPDLKLYISLLEQWIINTLDKLDVNAYTIDGRIGIWVNLDNAPAKIGAIGVRIKKWITYHGIAVNLNTDISRYSGIIPCGINDFPVTSLINIGIEITMSDFDYLLKKEFEKLF
ncbi:Octanoyltransferase [Candidatus Megaera venefica]|uniref:Octanoyltransferase n=1 Tax=Candidatus Megaera venefica TaxID=2055910 RepID=A0ABU5NBW4_9RICK|nr:lipoyl(octanoyl) transferase LipB [Candidatus Megaera venefica]MEA0970632.1 Octanoyltransferase [Candidatus Megaera venefica]